MNDAVSSQDTYARPGAEVTRLNEPGSGRVSLTGAVRTAWLGHLPGSCALEIGGAEGDRIKLVSS